MKRLTVLIDNGHGENTPGKRSPELFTGGRLLEWEYTRAIALRAAANADTFGVKVVLVAPEMNDTPLRERAKRVNDYIKEHTNEHCVLFSIHGNAAGDGKEWKSARGFEAWTTPGQNNSDKLATALYEQVGRYLPGVRLRTDKSDGDPDKEARFTILQLANCPAVLSECLFYDNREDVAMMMSENIQNLFAVAHLAAAINYFSNLRK